MSGVGDLRASSISRAGSTDYGYLDTLSTGRNNLETENLIRREMDATPGNNSPVDGQSMGPESPHVASDSHQTRKLPETDKLSLANASAADREIAHGVWTTSENREDEVRDALGRMINWVDQLTLALQTALREKEELETTLRVTQSNLALALSNTEMLEAALKRDASGRRADVGWQRSISSPSASPLPASPNTTMTKSETGFFKFLRNNTGVSSPPIGMPGSHHGHHSSTGSSRLHTPQSSFDSPTPGPGPLKGQQLTSPSMPSLHAASGHSRKEEDLAQALQKERANTVKALQEKQKLEEELESLSQALFEEANKMVATERRQKAQIEEDLHSLLQEKEALKSALKIVEGENATLRSGGKVATLDGTKPHIPATSDADSVIGKEHTRALMIDTDRAEGAIAVPHAINLTQTPSTSDIQETKGEPSKNAAENDAVKIDSAPAVDEMPNPWANPTPPNGLGSEPRSYDYSNAV